MNPNQVPVGNQPQPPEFTEKALLTKFSFSLTRAECIILVNVLRALQLPLGDFKLKVASELLDKIEATAIQSITASDYKKPGTDPAAAPLPQTPAVQTN